MTNPNTTARAPTKDELAAYAEWLFMEFRLLSIELWPETCGGPDAQIGEDNRAGLSRAICDDVFVPNGSQARGFHFRMTAAPGGTCQSRHLAA